MVHPVIRRPKALLGLKSFTYSSNLDVMVLQGFELWDPEQQVSAELQNQIFTCDHTLKMGLQAWLCIQHVDNEQPGVVIKPSAYAMQTQSGTAVCTP